MSVRSCAALLLAGWMLAPAAFGQRHEAEDVEVIRPPKVKPAETEKKPELARVVERIVEKTNRFRKEQGKSEVRTSAKLAAAARYFADFVARTDRYGHRADGSRPADRAEKHGYDYCIVLENVAYQYRSSGFTTEELGGGFFEGWKNSQGHRKNMLDADVTDTGVAVARSEKTGYYYAVQMFGRPKSKAVEFQISNEAGTEIRYRIGDEPFSLPPLYTRTHTRCRPADVKIQFPDDKEKGETVRPAGGERFVVTRDGERLRVKKE